MPSRTTQSAPPPPLPSACTGPAEWAVYNKFKRELQAADPECPPPTMQEWREMMGLSSGQSGDRATARTCRPAGRNAQRREAMVIDPALLETEETGGGLSRNGRKRKDRRSKHGGRRRRRHCRQGTESGAESSSDTESSSDADSSSESEPNIAPRLILMANRTELNKRQQTTKSELVTKNRRLDACLLYEEKHGVNPQPLIETPWMTEEVSTFSASDDAKQQMFYSEAKEKSGLTNEDIARGIKMLELRSFTWRTNRVTQIYHELDDLYNANLKAEVPQVHRRIDLGHISRTNVPDLKRLISLVLVNTTWLKRWQAERHGARDQDIKFKVKNPRGFRDLELTDEEAGGTREDRAGGEGLVQNRSEGSSCRHGEDADSTGEEEDDET
ncbi:uncharacterized protein PHACADRAFT_202545 [Phanerochaete carnosa HHB-10118-sp]|uniref:Uncharacterized protein n=1 Tax=Phanerochaete carnosa (strain HHB-10118-sp) TaxID=650164 RepID=K5VPZ0_PHACS|nr:uncharacterized protein PHACADRAFT_202545 [Phanerochaete carnosa HHB-10118-sp]EKM48659.1 hypothetical protein PHACADRAFT_202545 [Phanerochaete carnosa HHB-10118-sp]